MLYILQQNRITSLITILLKCTSLAFVTPIIYRLDFSAT